ncbi:MAG TPA: hypothetical protein PLZ45_05100 [Ferruginibacter sp.]|jgi:hypothetical protein|nr:hypothetical protein [Chitinophagaceae bacterium]HRI24027.1 hypothetical protein [Ferruginibacter sp.]
MLKKDNFLFGFILGLIAPIGGFIIYKYYKFSIYSWKEVLNFFFFEPDGHRLLTVAISLSLLANALFFTLYINARIDKTAKGIFWATLIYAITALSIKTFG